MTERMRGAALLHLKRAEVADLTAKIARLTPREIEEWDEPVTYDELLTRAQYLVSLETWPQDQVQARLIEIASLIGHEEQELELFEPEMTIQERMWIGQIEHDLKEERLILQALLDTHA